MQGCARFCKVLKYTYNAIWQFETNISYIYDIWYICVDKYSLCINKYILQFKQIHFALWTNTFCTWNKYILRFEQMPFVLETNTLVTGGTWPLAAASHWSDSSASDWSGLRYTVNTAPAGLDWKGFSWALYILQWKQMYFEMRENTLVSVFCIMREKKQTPLQWYWVFSAELS